MWGDASRLSNMTCSNSIVPNDDVYLVMELAFTWILPLLEVQL